MRVRSIVLLALIAMVLCESDSSLADSGQKITPPALLTPSPATYPNTALQARTGATVELELTVDATGSVTHATILRAVLDNPASVNSSNTAQPVHVQPFSQAAIEASQGLRFSPGYVDGKAIAVRVRFTYRFEPPPIAPAPAPSGPIPSRPVPSAPPQPPGTIEGFVRQRGTREPVVSAIVRVFPNHGDGLETTTDALGRFSFPMLSSGSWRIEAIAEGFLPFRASETIRSNESVQLTAYVERARFNPYDIDVSAARPRKEVVRRNLDRADIVAVPGTLGDPVQVVGNLPGVARPAATSGDIIVRGSGPNDTGVFIDSIGVPIIYHFGGLRSVIPAEMVGTIDFLPGNFSVRYGRAMGGILNVNLRSLRPQRFGGSVDISMLDAGVYLQTPLGKNLSLAIGGRRSYVDAFLSAAMPKDVVELTTAPVYYDYQTLLDWRPTPAHRLKTFFMGSSDALRMLFQNPEQMNVQLQSGNANLSTLFHRGNVEYLYAPSSRLIQTLRLSAGHDSMRIGFGGLFRYYSDTTSLELRDDVSLQLNDRITLNLGVDTRLQVQHIDVLAPRPPREGQGVVNSAGNGTNFKDRIFTQVEAVRVLVAPFIEADIKLGRLTFVPGARVEYFSQVDEVAFDPRLTVSYQLTSDWVAKAGIALVHQPPTPQETDKAFGNPKLALQRALQLSTGVSWQPRKYLSFDATFFYKDLRQLVSSSAEVVQRADKLVPQVYDNNGRGRVIGVELFADHRFNANFRGWISYTLMTARRTDSGSSRSRPFDFDQRHILNLVASYELPKNWRIGLRWRFISGNPYTPIVGSTFVSDYDVYEPIAGVINSSRLDAFHQLDLRVDKRWLFDAWRLTTYISLTNAYARKNVESLAYNYDFSQTGVVRGLPILPILGVQGEF